MSFLLNPYRFATSSAPIDGTQGSTNAGILAAVYFTVSGGTVTIVGQKNVSSVTRRTDGKFQINFTSTLANANYGLLGAARFIDAITDSCAVVQPNRNSTSGWNTYSTSSVDILVSGVDSSTGFDPVSCAVVIFDPASVGSDYLAAASFTVSGTTPTLQLNSNVSSVPRQATGVYRGTFTSALGNSDYSLFGSTRYADFTSDASALFGHNREATGPLDTHSTSAIDLSVGRLCGAGAGSFFDPARVSFLIRNSDVAPRGTLASVRFSVSGGVATIIRSWNVSSITYQTTGCYKINFTTALIDTDYAVFCSGKFADGTTNDAPGIGPNRKNDSPLRNTKSTTAVDIVSRGWAGSNFDSDFIDVWILKPWLM